MSSSSRVPQDQEVVAVECCSCFGRSSNNRSTTTKGAAAAETASTTAPPRGTTRGRRQSTKRASIYFEAKNGIIEEASLEFFDALEDTEDAQADGFNYSAAFHTAVPPDNHDDEDDYPVITRAVAPARSRRRMSILEPETLLRDLEPITDNNEEEEARPSRVSFVRRASTDVKRGLQTARAAAAASAIVERGFPGQLDAREVQECQDFYRTVTARKGTIRDIVFCYTNLDSIQEEEPYALCRFLRPVKFSADACMTRYENLQSLWEKAAKDNFYYDLPTHMGIPPSLFQKFYPFFYQGTAKNGCPVNYFRATKIHVEGLLSMVTMEQIQYNAWHTCRHAFPAMIAKAKVKNPNFVRFESISVIDLEGLGSNQASSEAMEIMKQASTVGDFFPETMHAMLILNAPAWFSVTWRVIRTFLDPRTARKIEVYANRSKGQIRLQQLVSRSEIPHDFGGTGPPTGSHEDESSSQKPKTREALHILHVSKKGRATQEVPSLAEVAANETVTALRIFSRSTTGVLVDVYQNDTQPLVQKFAVHPSEGATPSDANSTSLDPYVFNALSPGQTVQGPCRISLTAHADPQEKKPPNKSSHGYFVVVAFIRES